MVIVILLVRYHISWEVITKGSHISNNNVNLRDYFSHKPDMFNIYALARVLCEFYE